MLALYILALVAEVAGLVLAADGLRRTWRDFRHPEDAFWEPVTGRAKAAGRWTRVRLRRLIRKPVPLATVQIVDLAANLTAGSSLVVAKGWVVPPAEDTTAYIEYLTRRIDHLTEQVQEVKTQVQVNTNADAERHAEATAAISEIRYEVNRQVRTLTIDGLHEQAWGWFLILIGTILGGLGNILSLS